MCWLPRQQYMMEFHSSIATTDHGVSTNACLALSIDHDLKRLRKL
jgi:hypothetical protein